MASITYSNGSIYYNGYQLATTEDISKALEPIKDASNNYFINAYIANSYVNRVTGYVATMVSPVPWVSQTTYDKNGFNLIIEPITDLFKNSFYIFNGSFNVLFDISLFTTTDFITMTIITLITDKALSDNNFNYNNILYANTAQPVIFLGLSSYRDYVVYLNGQVETKSKTSLYLYLQVITRNEDIKSTGIQTEQVIDISNGIFISKSNFAIVKYPKD